VCFTEFILLSFFQVYIFKALLIINFCLYFCDFTIKTIIAFTIASTCYCTSSKDPAGTDEMPKSVKSFSTAPFDNLIVPGFFLHFCESQFPF